MREYLNIIIKFCVLLILFEFLPFVSSSCLGIFCKKEKFVQGPINLAQAKGQLEQCQSELFNDTMKIRRITYKYEKTKNINEVTENKDKNKPKKCKVYKGIAINDTNEYYCVILKIVEEKEEFKNEKNILMNIKLKQKNEEDQESNIIELYNYGNWKQDGSLKHVIVLEYGGESLSSYWKRKIKEENITYANLFIEAIKLLKQVAKILQKIHSYNIIHLDLKIGNLVIYNENLKIIDFGIAKVLSNKMLKKCKGNEECKSNLVIKENIKLGTIRYMSPEHINRTKPKVSQKSDNYSFGVLAYVLLDNAVNKTIVIPNIFDKFDILLEKLENTNVYDSAKQLKELIEKCMNLDPKERPTATNILEELENINIPNVENNEEIEELN